MADLRADSTEKENAIAAAPANKLRGLVKTLAILQLKRGKREISVRELALFEIEGKVAPGIGGVGDGGWMYEVLKIIG